jgi:uncharacterized membrane protein
VGAGLVLAVYPEQCTASDVVRRLEEASGEHTALRSSAVVQVSASGSFSVTTTDLPGQASPFWGILWEALFAMVFLVPAPGTAYGAHLGSIFGAIDRAGIDEDARRRIRAALGPRTSGIAFLLTDDTSSFVTDLLRAQGGTVIDAHLAIDPGSELVRELGGPLA